MLALAVFYFIYVVYCGISMLVYACKVKKFEASDAFDACADLSLSALLLLVGLAVEKLIVYNWLLFSIPLLLHIGCRLYLRKLSKAKKDT